MPIRRLLGSLIVATAIASWSESAAEAVIDETVPSVAKLENRPLSRAPAGPVAPFKPNRSLFLCPGMKVQNAPVRTEGRRVLRYKPFLEPSPGVFVAYAPMRDACLTSGYGRRWGRMHFGLDFASAPHSMVYAAGEGRIVEAGFQGTYGFTVLIEHADQVFTRYAHLASFHRDVAIGEWVSYGAPLGPMGNTSTIDIGAHLHYEILGYRPDPIRGESRLTPLNPLVLPGRDYAIFNTVAAKSGD